MADDETQEAATKNIAAWTGSRHKVQRDFRGDEAQERIAEELIRIRYEMTAIRKILERRK